MDISVIIPTCNGESTLRELFAVLHYQTLQPDEILVVDSSSGDDSARICKEYGAQVVTIPKEEFDHGGTRTMMANRAHGDILVFFTQDAIPATRQSLERLVAPIIEDEQVVSTYGRQLPGKDASFAAAHLRRFNYPENAAIRCYEDRRDLGIKTIFTSNSFAAYRKSALEAVGYFKNGLIFGEDTCTVGRLLEKGFKVGYVSEATVYHSHNYDLWQELRRSFDIGVLHASESSLFEDFGRAENRGLEYVRSGVRELYQRRRYAESVEFLVRSLLKLVGYKAGRRYKKLPSGIARSLSMNQTWWRNR